MVVGAWTFGGVRTLPILERSVSSRLMARKSRGAAVPPVWTSVLAVIAHPDEASIGLGGFLDAFIIAGARVEVLCLTHGQAWTLHDAPGDLAALRGAEVASAADVLGPVRVKMEDCPYGALGELCQTSLANVVVDAADSCHPDGLLVFDTPAATGQLDHVCASSVSLRAAETLDLPVLGWTFSEEVAAQLRGGFGASAGGHDQGQVDLRVTIDRARKRMASREGAGPVLPGSVMRRKLELLAETESVRWLRA